MVIWISILINMPFFSIIIPTYNRAHVIMRPIDSVLRQTFEDWELIIVDDGSTDDTKSIIESYHDNRIRYVWQENQERSAARNHGIALAKGEWICFLDSDDDYYPNHLANHLGNHGDQNLGNHGGLPLQKIRLNSYFFLFKFIKIRTRNLGCSLSMSWISITFFKKLNRFF